MNALHCLLPVATTVAAVLFAVAWLLFARHSHQVGEIVVVTLAGRVRSRLLRLIVPFFAKVTQARARIRWRHRDHHPHHLRDLYRHCHSLRPRRAGWRSLACAFQLPQWRLRDRITAPGRPDMSTPHRNRSLCHRERRVPTGAGTPLSIRSRPQSGRHALVASSRTIVAPGCIEGDGGRIQRGRRSRCRARQTNPRRRRISP